ncbi:hypothetical protein J2T37_001514 [Neisseria perflava]|nr:hypothetical protein [Neisseria perflava]MCP1772709.1 hypothetical protein [Neisseria perflava]
MKDLNKNLVDPIKLTFDSGIYENGYTNQNLENILQNEVLRQIDKSNTNHIGYFHQNIFQYINSQNWSVPKTGFDIVNPQQKIYVEMKNKHNTMNSSSSAKTYIRMQNKLLNDPEATCYLAEIIAAKSQNIEWVCTVDKQQMKHKQIRRISIDKFYELVTGDKFAFQKLCRILPHVISNVVSKQKKRVIQNTVIEDLKAQETNHILQSLYLLAFKTYQGFENFNLNE